MADLFEAVQLNDLNRTRFLISTGVDILEKDEYGWTALHWASSEGHLEIAKLLIELYVARNANLSEKTNSGFTALHLVCHRVCRRGYLDIAKLLVESYVATNVNISEKDEEGWTALHEASYFGHLEIVKYLVESGLDIDITNTKGKTAIDVAKTKEIKDFLMEQLEIQKNSYILK